MLRANMGRNKISGFYFKFTLIARLHCYKLTVQDIQRGSRKWRRILANHLPQCNNVRLHLSGAVMHDKIAVTLQELLAIANHELAIREDHKKDSVITGIDKGPGTFRLVITVESIVFESEEHKELAQSLYDRYLLKH